MGLPCQKMIMESDQVQDVDIEDSPVREHAVELSRLIHLFYKNSSALKSPRGREFVQKMIALHPRVEQAVEMFASGDGEGAGDLIFKLLIAAHVEFDTIAQAHEKIEDFEATLFVRKDSNWYERAKQKANPAPEAPKKCLDGSSLSKPLELWLAGRPAREIYSPALQWLDRIYDGKPAKWWLTNCVTGFPFTVEALTGAKVRPILLSVKPEIGPAALRIIIQRKDGRVVIVWWGPHGEYDDLAGRGNHSMLVNLPRTPVLQMPT